MINGVPQGIVLPGIIFLVYVNYINYNSGAENYMRMVTVDAKIQRTVKDVNSCKESQNDLLRFYEWSYQSQRELRAVKCHVIKFGKGTERLVWDYKLDGKSLQVSEKEKNEGVPMNSSFSPGDHINEKARNMLNLCANMRVPTFHVHR